VLSFPRCGGGAAVVAHPNLFHDALERTAVAAWQVVQDERGLTVRLVGVGAVNLVASVERAVRELFEAIGAETPRITVEPIERLERGPTGKAPLIVSKLGRPTPA
jgi:hypothetical protein